MRHRYCQLAYGKCWALPSGFIADYNTTRLHSPLGWRTAQQQGERVDAALADMKTLSLIPAEKHVWRGQK